MSRLWAPMQVFTSMQPQYIIIQLEPPLLLIFCLPQNCLIPQSFFSKNFHVMHFLEIECKQVLKMRMLWMIKHLVYWIIKKEIILCMQAGVYRKKTILCRQAGQLRIQSNFQLQQYLMQNNDLTIQPVEVCLISFFSSSSLLALMFIFHLFDWWC